MSDDSQHKPPFAPRKETRLSGMSALHGELAEPMMDFPSEPPPSVAPPPMVDFGEEPPPPPEDEHALMRGEDFGKWAEPEAPKRSIDTMVGKLVDGRYQIKGMIGRGGMGAVFEAFQPSVQRTVALKVLLREFAENETVIKRFHKEALAASRLKHPNTISVYDFGQTDDGVLFIAMEYLDGVDLGMVLEQGALPVDRALGIMRQVCKSLSEAHKAGIIHRDLKPDNVFLTEVEGEIDFVKVLDFGVAKLREGDGHERTLTQAGTMFGTPKYMSPEQTRSTQLDPRSDIYSLGVILYEMLLGEPPFVSDNPLSILIAHVNEAPAPFADRQPDLELPPVVEAVVFQALSKDREQRQANVDVLLDQVEALIALRAGTPFAELADRLPDPALYGLGAAPAIAPPVRIADVVLDPRPPREERRAPVVPIVLAAVVVTGVLFAIFGLEPDPVTPSDPSEKAMAAVSGGQSGEPPAPPPLPPVVDAAAPEPASYEFFIRTRPDGLTFEQLVGGEPRPLALAGQADDGSSVRVKLDAPARLRASKAGFVPFEFDLDPAEPKAAISEIKLEKKPTPVKPRTRPVRPKQPPVGRPDPRPIAAPPTPPPAQPEPEPGPIELPEPESNLIELD